MRLTFLALLYLTSLTFALVSNFWWPAFSVGAVLLGFWVYQILHQPPSKTTIED